MRLPAGRANAGISRRRFVTQAPAAGLGAGAALLGGCPCGCGSAVAFADEPVAASVAVGAKGYAVEPVRDGLFFVTDGAYNAMFLVSSEGVIACDAPPSLGENYLRAIREVTDRPVTHLVYSHEHVDHIAGSRLFPADVTILANRRTAELLAGRRDPSRRLPTVTFDDHYTLTLGDQILELSYKGVNHSIDNCFIFAPRQRSLMLVDVIYPGWMPYKNLGVSIDVPGLVEAHRQVLAYDFDALIAGHVSRPGTRADVAAQLELMADLAQAAERAYAGLSFPAFVSAARAQGSAKSVWELHNDYEQRLVDRVADELRPRWIGRLAGVDTYLRDNCWAMLETFVVQGRPHFEA